MIRSQTLAVSAFAQANLNRKAGKTEISISTSTIYGTVSLIDATSVTGTVSVPVTTQNTVYNTQINSIAFAKAG